MKILPPRERFGRVDSAAELRVADLLAQAHTAEPECALYSVLLPAHEYKRMSEIDFLVVWDDVVLVIEVKGGRLRRQSGSWVFTDRYGQQHTKREGPFAQARTAMFALERRLRDNDPTIDAVIGYMVITPDQSLEADVEWEPAQHLGPEAMTVRAFEQGLRRARTYWREKSRQVRGGMYQAVLNATRPDFDRVPSLRALTTGLESDFVRLAHDQYRYLTLTDSSQRLLCEGGAGSGKTILAVETALRAAHDGHRVLLTCRSEALAAVLREAVRASDVVCRPLSGLPALDPVDFLVLDEAQDVLDIETYLHLGSLIKGGWEEGRWRVFCDPNNQAAVDGHLDEEVLGELRKAGHRITLPNNCRNTASVVRQTRLLTGARIEDPLAPAGPTVAYVYPNDSADAAARLDQRLDELAREEVDLADVAVITMCARAQDSCATETKAHRRRRLVESGRPGARAAARLVTAREIKGLEVAHACVVDVDDLTDPAAIARLYVGMTRPRISLWVALSDAARREAAAAATTGGSR